MASSELGTWAAIAAVCLVGYGGWTVLKGAQAKGDLIVGDCPIGSNLVGKHPPDGVEQWCQKETAGGSFIKHGRHRVWDKDGRLAVDAWYADGVQQGEVKVWAEGRPWMSGKMVNGERDDFWRICSAETGAPQALEVYETGRLTQTYSWENVNGTLFSNGTDDRAAAGYARGLLTAWCSSR